MYFEVGGTGDKTVLFLHGWGGNIHSFDTVAKHIADKYKTVNLEFAGFGNSEEPQVAWSVENYADDVFSLLKELGIDSVSIVAHSFGGRVAIKLAYKYPEIVDKLVLVDSAGIKPRRGIKYFFAVRYFKLLKYFVAKKILDPKVLSGRGSSDYSALSETMKKTFIKVVNEDLKDNAKSIIAETLIVWGGKDRDTPLFMAKKLNKLIKGSAIVLFPDSGHFAYIENFVQFLRVLESFL